MDLVSISRVRKKTLKLVSEVKEIVGVSTSGDHIYKEPRGGGLYDQWPVKQHTHGHYVELVKSWQSRVYYPNPPEIGGRYPHFDEQGLSICPLVIFCRIAMGLLPGT